MMKARLSKSAYATLMISLATSLSLSPLCAAQNYGKAFGSRLAVTDQQAAELALVSEATKRFEAERRLSRTKITAYATSAEFSAEVLNEMIQAHAELVSKNVTDEAGLVSAFHASLDETQREVWAEHQAKNIAKAERREASKREKTSE